MSQYFKRASKEQLRDYQQRAGLIRSYNAGLRSKIALVLWNEMHDIHYVAKYFGITRDAAYKMVRKGKELTNETPTHTPES